MCNCAEYEIGKPEKGWGWSAEILPQYKGMISENNLSYWCRLPEYGVEVKIAKNSIGGARIKNGIKMRLSEDALKQHILALVLPYMTPTEFISINDAARSDGAKEGRNKLRQELGKLLNYE